MSRMPQSKNRRRAKVAGISLILVSVVAFLTGKWLLDPPPPKVSPSRAHAIIKKTRQSSKVPRFFSEFVGRQVGIDEADVVLHGLSASELSELRFERQLRAIDITWYPLLYDSKMDGYVVMAWYAEPGASGEISIAGKSVRAIRWPGAAFRINALDMASRMRRLPKVTSREGIASPILGEVVGKSEMRGLSIIGKPLDLIVVKATDSEYIYGWRSYAGLQEAKGSTVDVVAIYGN